MTKQLEKYAFWAGLAVVAVVVLKISNSSVKNVAAGIAGGIVGGTIDAVQGAVVGSYEALPEAIKPSSSNNVFYQGTNKIVEALTGEKGQTLGGWIYDVTH